MEAIPNTKEPASGINDEILPEQGTSSNPLPNVCLDYKHSKFVLSSIIRCKWFTCESFYFDLEH